MNELTSTAERIATIKKQLRSHPLIQFVGERRAVLDPIKDAPRSPYKPLLAMVDLSVASKKPVQTQSELDAVTEDVFEGFDTGFIWLGRKPRDLYAPHPPMAHLAQGLAFYVPNITMSVDSVFVQTSFYPDRTLASLYLMHQSVREEEVNQTTRPELNELGKWINEELVALWRSGTNLNDHYFGRRN